MVLRHDCTIKILYFTATMKFKGTLKKKNLVKKVTQRRNQFFFLRRPKATKSKKPFKRFLNRKNKAIGYTSTRAYTNFGTFAFKSLMPYRLEIDQVESMRRFFVKYYKRRIKFIFRTISFDCPLTKKGSGTRMGGGKGKLDHFTARVERGQLFMEVVGLQNKMHQPKLYAGLKRLPVKLCKTYIKDNILFLK